MKLRIQWRRSRERGILLWLERFLILAGCLALGYCAVAYFEAEVYQAYEIRELDQLARSAAAARSGVAEVARTSAPISDGAPVSKLEIPRIGISVAVVEGVESRILRIGAGHIPGTALPGESGNIGIAGHRDTFFRNLRDIRRDDLITLTRDGRTYEYEVESVRVVDPTDVGVLAATREPVLTLVTCYPFSFVGPAPQRYIIRAQEVARW